MAITKIIAIRDRLDKRVNYAVNGEKTTLDTGITYAANPEKTEQLFFTSAINCESCETAFAEMQATKQRFGKLGGVVGYHFIQSFTPGEVTPEQAHAIGVAFARRLFGDRYEVVIGTHLDTRCPTCLTNSAHWTTIHFWRTNMKLKEPKETVYFGLTARQLICSLLAVGTAVGLYFALRGVLDRETLGWLCIVGAAPMAAAGFFHYNGLTLEQFLWAWCKTNFLLAGRRLWHSENYLYDLWEEDKK